MLPSETAVLNEGERYLPNYRVYNAAMHLGHMASYREALRYSYGRRVLDLGCGVGYGAFFLASYGAANLVALDMGALTVQYAKTAYPHSKLRYLQGNALQLPFANASFDFVFSSQVIEHVPDARCFLREIRRVLTPEGTCLIVTPNQVLFSPVGTSANPHHISEMSWDVFEANFRDVFPQAHFYGIPQRCLYTPSGSTVPTTKPNEDIKLIDYVPQAHNLEECENMIGLGQNAAGYVLPALPSKIAELSQILQPIFWDKQAKQWVLLGLSGGATAGDAIEQKLGQKLTLHFISPLPQLYKIELDLFDELQYPLVIKLLRRGTNSTEELVANLSILPPCKTIELVFAPLADSEGVHFIAEIHIDKKWYWPLGSSPKVRWAVARVGGKNWLGTELLRAPIVLRTLHQGLPEISA